MCSDRVAFQIGSVTVYWYGIFVGLGFLAAMLLMQWRGKRSGLSGAVISDLCFAAIFGGILGARLLYVILNYREYVQNPIEVLRIDHGGLVFYGGLAGGTAGVAWLIRRRNLAWGKVADLAALGLPLGQAIGRGGCLVNGCCFGHPWNSALAINYPKLSSIWVTQVDKELITSYSEKCLSVFPSQITQSGINLIIFAVLLVASTRIKGPGKIFSLYLILYPLGRFLNEFTRGDYYNYYWGLTISQLICVGLLPVGWYLFHKLEKTPVRT